MKRLLSRMLALALCLSMLAASALAAETAVMSEPPEDERWLIRDMETVGDTVYLLTSIRDNMQLWRWTADMQHAEKLAENLIGAEFWDSMEILCSKKESEAGNEKLDLEHAITVIFTDGEKLYGFNHLNGLVYAISVTEQGLAYEDVATLPYTNPIYDAGAEFGSFISPVEVIKSGDWMLWYATDRATRNYDERLLAFNLKTGAVKQAVLPQPYEVTAYKEGKVLALCNADSKQQEQGSYTLYTYDPQTDLVEMIGMIPRGVNVREIVYDKALDAVVYQDKTRIMGWMEETGAEQLGFIPTSVFAHFAVAEGKLVYSTDDVNAAACALEKGYAAEHSLNILGGSMNEVLSQFYKEYLDVPFYYMNQSMDETLAEMMEREKDAPDLIKVSAGQYTELLAAGQLLDLSAYEDLKAYADVMYPVYREFVTQDGGLYGIPVYANAYDGWYINKAVMKDMGLTAEDVPTSLTELCEFATKWNNEYAEKYPHYTLLNNTAEYRERIFYAMLEGWADYCQYAGRELTLDDSVFREMLTALDAAELDKLNAALKQTDPEVSEYKQALIWTGCKDVGNWDVYMEDFSDRIFLPITLTPETPYTAAVENFAMWVVNANTDNGEYAAALLAEVVENLDAVHAYVLRSDKTEPVVRKSYAADIAGAQEVLALLESRLEESVNRATIEKRIAEQREYIETELARLQYEICPSAIENYLQVMLPAAFVALPDAVSSSDRNPEITGMIYRYIGGSLDAETLITNVDELLK